MGLHAETASGKNLRDGYVICQANKAGQRETPASSRSTVTQA